MQHSRRVTIERYDPSDEDVLRARLRTTGIQEYRFKIGRKSDPEWQFFDFNGARSSVRWQTLYSFGRKLTTAQRSAWFSYFDDGSLSDIPLGVST